MYVGLLYLKRDTTGYNTAAFPKVWYAYPGGHAAQFRLTQFYVIKRPMPLPARKAVELNGMLFRYYLLIYVSWLISGMTRRGTTVGGLYKH